jgi:hypothetical protein
MKKQTQAEIQIEAGKEIIDAILTLARAASKGFGNVELKFYGENCDKRGRWFHEHLQRVTPPVLSKNDVNFKTDSFSFRFEK